MNRSMDRSIELDGAFEAHEPNGPGPAASRARPDHDSDSDPTTPIPHPQQMETHEGVSGLYNIQFERVSTPDHKIGVCVHFLVANVSM